MIIYRSNERPIELTADELYQAYLEQEHKFDVMDIEDILDQLTDEECLDMYDVEKSVLIDYVDEIAEKKRRNMDKYDLSWETARDEAIADCASRHARQ